jgi:hypothetical protein
MIGPSRAFLLLAKTERPAQFLQIWASVAFAERVALMKRAAEETGGTAALFSGRAPTEANTNNEIDSKSFVGVGNGGSHEYSRRFCNNFINGACKNGTECALSHEIYTKYGFLPPPSAFCFR